MSESGSDDELFPINYEIPPRYGPFNYQDAWNTPRVLKEIMNTNFSYLLDYIAKGGSLDVMDNHGNTPLHAAVFGGKNSILKATSVCSLEILIYLLNFANVSKNATNFAGLTPLMDSMNLLKCELLTIALIDGGCDLNVALPSGETALHFAMDTNRVRAAKLMLDRDVNVNAVNFAGYTPLHNAVFANNYEGVCTLLCYGAYTDVYNDTNMTPLMLALHHPEFLRIAHVMYDFVVPDNEPNCDGFSPLLFALNSRCSLAVEMIRDGYDVNYVDAVTSLYLAIFYDDSRVFRAIWPKFEHDLLMLGKPRNFLVRYMTCCTFPLDEWLECLYMLINCCAGTYLIGALTHKMEIVVNQLIVRRVPAVERLSILFIILSYGGRLSFNCLSLMANSGGALDHFIHMEIGGGWTGAAPSDLIIAHYFWLETSNVSNDVSVRFDVKAKLILQYFGRLRKLRVRNGVLKRRYAQAPLLKDVARMAVRQLFRQHYAIQTSCAFYTLMNHLCLPQAIQDIIRFKTPIYSI